MMASFSYDEIGRRGSEGGMMPSSITRMEGGRNKPPGSFSSPSWEYYVQIQSKLANDFHQNQDKTKQRIIPKV